jgi:hypothetical protein
MAATASPRTFRPPPRDSCDSCGDPLLPNRIYVGFISQAHALYVCEPCAAWHSSEQFVLYTVAQAQRVIRATHAHLNAARAMEREVV